MALDEKSVMATPPLPRLPTSAQALAWIATALRLSDMRSGTSEVSAATAKRIAGCHPSVSDAKVTALLTGLVDALFTPAYLAARNVKGDEIAAHRTVLLAGIEGGLGAWDRFACFLNVASNAERPALLMPLGVLVLDEIGIRLAAYLTLYGNVVPAWRRTESSLTFDGIAGTLQSLRKRSRPKTSDAALGKKARVASHTFRDLRDGRRLPKEDTLLALAQALSRPGVDGLTMDDVTFELRLACLVAEVRKALELHRDVAAELPSVRVHLFDFRRYGPVDLAEIVAQGRQWSRWLEVQDRVQVEVRSELVRSFMTMKADMERSARAVERLSEQDPEKALQLAAEQIRKMGELSREMLGGFPSSERSLPGDVTRLIESLSAKFLAIAEGRTVPENVGIDLDAFEAKSLCAQALAPWSRLTRDQREDLYRQAVEMDPSCAEVRVELARFLKGDGRSGEAVQHLKLAVMLDGTYSLARKALADALLDAGRYEEVLDHVDLLERQIGLSSQLTLLRGASLLRLGRATAAFDVFDRALRASPQDGICHGGMSEVLEAQGDHAGARRHRQAFETLLGQRSPCALLVSKAKRSGRG